MTSLCPLQYNEYNCYTFPTPNLLPFEHLQFSTFNHSFFYLKIW